MVSLIGILSPHITTRSAAFRAGRVQSALVAASLGVLPLGHIFIPSLFETPTRYILSAVPSDHSSKATPASRF